VKRNSVRNADNRLDFTGWELARRSLYSADMHTDDNAPESIREVDDAAIAEQVSRIAEIFDLSYDEIVAAFRNNS
jgi:hypothetical protein